MTHQFFVHYKPLQHQSSGHMPAARAPTKENHASPTHPNLNRRQINGLSRANKMKIPRQTFDLTGFCYLLSELMPHSTFNCLVTFLFCSQQLGIEAHELEYTISNMITEIDQHFNF
eukprot:591059_1